MKEKETVLTQKGQVTIPVAVRRALGLKPRDKVIFEIVGEEKIARLRPAASKVERWFGAVEAKSTPENFQGIRDEFEKAVADAVVEETK